MRIKQLIERLGGDARSALEAAANAAHARTHHEVEVEHVLAEMLNQPQSEAVVLLKAFGLDPTLLAEDLRHGLSTLRTGNTRTPVLSRDIPRWLEAGWLLASLECKAPSVGAGHLVAALVDDSELRRAVGAPLDRLGRIPREELLAQLPRIFRQPAEAPPAGPPAPGSTAPLQDGKPTPSLDRYTTNLTDLARAGKLDPVLGRENEVRQMIDILLRRRQNNPILTGEPGVGKTAVAEGLAARIAEGSVPDPLKVVTVRTLDLGLLQAGASVKGEFENRLRQVIDEVKASLVPIVLFIDEAHTLIGAGGQAGQNDAANLLKPALARGELRTIAATTWAEYKKYFEKDAALARRFQVVKVEEPEEDDAIQMVRGVAVAMEKHHKVRILDAAVQAAVRLSSRYISGRQLPDKAISVLDTACARVALSRAGLPPVLEDLDRLLANLDREVEALHKEPEDPTHQARLEELAARRKVLEQDRAVEHERFLEQKTLVEGIQQLRTACSQPEPPAEAPGALGEAQRKLRSLHEAQPLCYDCVDGGTIAEVISGWTGIPLGRMVTDEIDAVRRLDALLGQRVLGQPEALRTLARSLQVARAGLEDPTRPKGVFLLVGPSGVGKTETALALADTLYGGEKNLISINLSEYQEAHTVSGLKGSPPGYVGYGEGGVLTEAVRRKPHSVLLLDEVEKAHPDVLELFYQVFDRGRLEDAEGREIDFRHTIIILTSNIGSDLVLRAAEHGVTVDGVSRPPTAEDLAELLRDTLLRAFKPAFLGRLTVVPYFPVKDDVLKDILRLKLQRLQGRIGDSHGIQLTWDNALVEHLSARCTEVESGARNAEAILSSQVTSLLSEHVLEALAEGRKLRKIALQVRQGRIRLKTT